MPKPSVSSNIWLMNIPNMNLPSAKRQYSKKDGAAGWDQRKLLITLSFKWQNSFTTAVAFQAPLCDGAMKEKLMLMAFELIDWDTIRDTDYSSCWLVQPLDD